MPQYRQERNYENVNKALYEGAGPYGIPKLDPVQCRTENWISFNYAKTCTDAEGHGVHFLSMTTSSSGCGQIPRQEVHTQLSAMRLGHRVTAQRI